MPNVSELTGRQKAAVLMIALGPEVSSRVLKHLREDEIEDLTLEIAGMRRVFPDVKDMVLEEFSEMYQASDFISRGGVDYAREMLSKALGEERAEAILHRLTSGCRCAPLTLLAEPMLLRFSALFKRAPPDNCVDHGLFGTGSGWNHTFRLKS